MTSLSSAEPISPRPRTSELADLRSLIHVPSWPVVLMAAAITIALLAATAVAPMPVFADNGTSLSDLWAAFDQAVFAGMATPVLIWVANKARPPSDMPPTQTGGKTGAGTVELGSGGDAVVPLEVEPPTLNTTGNDVVIEEISINSPTADVFEKYAPLGFEKLVTDVPQVFEKDPPLVYEKDPPLEFEKLGTDVPLDFEKVSPDLPLDYEKLDPGLDYEKLPSDAQTADYEKLP